MQRAYQNPVADGLNMSDCCCRTQASYFTGMESFLYSYWYLFVFVPYGFLTFSALTSPDLYEYEYFVVPLASLAL